MPDERSVLVFQVSGEAFALPLEEVQEIVPAAALLKPPGLPTVLEGILNLGGIAVPVLAINRLLGLPDQSLSLYAALVVLRNPGALLVEAADRIVSITTDRFLPIPSNHSFNDCAVAEILVEDRTVHVLSRERLLLEKEHRAIAELQAMAQQRLQDLMEQQA